MPDEAYIEMRCYIKYNLYYGQSEDDIRRALLEAGWQREVVEQAFLEAKEWLKTQGKAEEEEEEIPVPLPQNT